ncbi:MAG: serine/threonine protein kinase [Planctomycetaceae bacterium]|nr:serine/threonine protein kinase [Planctomycetaceae bacterium]
MALALKPTWVGEKIADGRYKILAQLGEGGMGTVYRAYDTRLETEVVLKCPRRDMLDPAFRTRFEREIRSLVRLTHPHVVTLLDIGDHDDVPFVVMQYLGAGSLKSRIYPGGTPVPQPPRSLRKWLPQIADALDFVHQQQYVHRDVKPANILFDEQGNAFLSDFGLTRVLTEESQRTEDQNLTQAGFLVGTAHYVAPEIVVGREIDGRCDQYSLAVTIFEALTATLPFNGPTSSAIVVKHARDPAPLLHEVLPSLSRELSEVIAQGMAKHPRRRFHRCADFAEAVLEHCRSPRSTSVTVNVPNPTSGEVTSHGVEGQIPCPKCQRILAIEPKFAGRRGVCQYCRSRVRIAGDLNSLTLIMPQAAPTNAAVIAANDTLPSGIQSRPSLPSGISSSPLTDSLDDSVVTLEERVFGLRISRRTATIMGVVLVMLCLLSVIFITNYASREPVDDLPKVRSSD